MQSPIVLSKTFTDEQCLSYAVYREASGQGIQTQRAVLDVILNRVKKERLGACKVLRKPSQFPYMKYGVKEVEHDWKLHYNVIKQFSPILTEDYIYFNSVRHKFGKHCKKIGDMYFCK